jgi:hypothetical protein
MRNEAHVIRYTITHVGKDGLRVLSRAAQGRYTFSTRDEAEEHLAAIRMNNAERTLRQLFGPTDTFQVRQCPCWPGHFDPKSIYFDDAEDERVGAL